MHGPYAFFSPDCQFTLPTTIRHIYTTLLTPPEYTYFERENNELISLMNTVSIIGPLADEVMRQHTRSIPRRLLIYCASTAQRNEEAHIMTASRYSGAIIRLTEITWLNINSFLFQSSSIPTTSSLRVKYHPSQ